MQGKRTKKNKRQLTEEQSIIGEKLSFGAAEAYKVLRTNIQFALPDEQKCRIIGVTSSCSGEGKSTTAVNLSYTLAQAGERVLLIEADMRLPTLSRRLNLQPTPGLSNILAGLLSAFDAIQKSEIHDNLECIIAGDLPPNPSELLGTKWMKTLMDVLSSNYDFIILDLPPVTEVVDAVVASKLTNGMVVVVRQNYANRRALAAAMQQLRYAEAKVLGFVMTCSELQKKGNYKKGYGYGYGYGAGKG